jgi:hypothetical protein
MIMINKLNYFLEFYRSARSLAGSGTPPFRTYLRAAKSGPSAMELNCDSSSDDEAAPMQSNQPISKPRPIPRAVSLNHHLLNSKV